MEKFNFLLYLLAAMLSLTGVMVLAVLAVGAPADFLWAAETEKSAEGPCKPTPEEPLGPFYRPDAPVRDRVGVGYVLSGLVRSAADCAPLAGTRIEFWLAGPDGNYDDDHRATVVSGPDGSYRFESNLPPRYSFRPPHIHLKVSAAGFKTLVTQHYPRPGQTRGTLDLVLVPAR